MKLMRACAVLAVVAVGAGACSTETQGQAVPAPVIKVGDGSEPRTTQAAPTTSTTPRQSDGPADPASPLDAVDPCDLFTAAAKTTLGVTGAPVAQRTNSARICQWKVAKESTADGYTFAVSVFPGLGLDKVVADGERTPITVGARRAVESLRAGGSVCAVSIEVTATSRVDVQANGSSDGSALCGKVRDAAALVEPELP